MSSFTNLVIAMQFFLPKQSPQAQETATLPPTASARTWSPLQGRDIKLTLSNYSA